MVSNKEQFFLAQDQIEEVGVKSTNLLEPAARNTAPAITLACLSLGADTVVLVTPSDHVIHEQKAYADAVKQAVSLAGEGHIVTFGIKPHSPETGYGYIKAEGFDALSFTEKPKKAAAKEYIASGDYFWNTGIFCFKVKTLLAGMAKHAASIHDACVEAYANASFNNSKIEPVLSDMNNIPKLSIDYALLEKTKNIKMVPCDMGWNDLGSFESLHAETEKYPSGITKNPNVVNIDSNNCLVLTEKAAALIDVKDLVIVDTEDALLIARHGSGQKVKKVLDNLAPEQKDLQNLHIEVHRPWGTYKVLEVADGYKIKKVVVKPGKRLSSQKHFHRNEHWIVIKGMAKVTIGKEEKIVATNESTYINMGEVHRLENPGKVDLEIIEAQVGEYTGEDDIVRFDDDFDRAPQ